MPEDRVKMLTVLAERGMEWKPGWNVDPLERDEVWDPFSDGRAAWELWEAMRKKPHKLRFAFFEALVALVDDAGWLEDLEPAHIARAAFEALEASHDSALEDAAKEVK